MSTEAPNPLARLQEVVQAHQSNQAAIEAHAAEIAKQKEEAAKGQKKQ